MEFQKVSPECKDLIRELLVVDTEKRLSAQEALNHQWFKNYDAGLIEESKGTTANGTDKKISDEVVSKLRSFKGQSSFKKAAMNLFVKTATEEEVQDLRAQFQAIDTDGTGMIDAQELHAILMQKRVNVSDAEVADMINQMDYHDNKQINYSEFLAASIDVQSFLTESRLKVVFNQFDTDASGVITEENIFFAMQKLGRETRREDVHSMIAQHDTNGDGVLNFEEFKSIFFGGKEIEE